MNCADLMSSPCNVLFSLLFGPGLCIRYVLGLVVSSPLLFWHVLLVQGELATPFFALLFFSPVPCETELPLDSVLLRFVGIFHRVVL